MIVITGRKEDVEKARDRILKIQSELVFGSYTLKGKKKHFLIVFT